MAFSNILKKIKFIILDRDGVINQESKDFIKSPGEWIPIPGSLEAIAQLTKMGFTLAVATNQSGIGRGLYTLETLFDIHIHMINQIEALGGHLITIAFCPHKPDDGCTCRKPAPGMFNQLCQQFQFIPHQTLAIGDSYRDIQAAEAGDCHAALVKTGNGLITLDQHRDDLSGVFIYEDLMQVALALK